MRNELPDVTARGVAGRAVAPRRLVVAWRHPRDLGLEVHSGLGLATAGSVGGGREGELDEDVA